MIGRGKLAYQARVHGCDLMSSGRGLGGLRRKSTQPSREILCSLHMVTISTRRPGRAMQWPIACSPRPSFFLLEPPAPPALSRPGCTAAAHSPAQPTPPGRCSAPASHRQNRVGWLSLCCLDCAVCMPPPKTQSRAQVAERQKNERSPRMTWHVHGARGKPLCTWSRVVAVARS